MICSECGALLFEAADNCPFCDAVLTDANPEAELAAELAAVSTQHQPESGTIVTAQQQPEWRREINQRVNLYRARRYPNQPDESQSPFPFHAGSGQKLEEREAESGYGANAAKAKRKPPRRLSE